MCVIMLLLPIPEKKSISNAIFISTFSSRPQEIFHVIIDENTQRCEFFSYFTKHGKSHIKLNMSSA